MRRTLTVIGCSKTAGVDYGDVYSLVLVNSPVLRMVNHYTSKEETIRGPNINLQRYFGVMVPPGL